MYAIAVITMMMQVIIIRMITMVTMTKTMITATAETTATMMMKELSNNNDINSSINKYNNCRHISMIVRFNTEIFPYWCWF